MKPILTCEDKNMFITETTGVEEVCLTFSDTALFDEDEGVQVSLSLFYICLIAISQHSLTSCNFLQQQLAVIFNQTNRRK